MKSTPDDLISAAASDPALAQLCDEIIERLQAGDGVDLASLALEHPEHADQLRRLLPALEALVDLGASAAANPSRVTSTQDKPHLAPRVLGDYRILREVGRGGMGVVYEAEQRSLNRRVALKVLPMAAALDVRQFQRFQLEAQAAACLHHNNIVPVFAVGTEGGVPFYAMQYIEGRTLADVIQELRRAEGLEQEPPTREGGAVARLADLTTTTLARSLVSAQPTASRIDAPGPNAPTEANDPSPSPLSPGEGHPVPVRKPSKTASSTRTRDYCRNIAGLGLQAAEALDHAHTRGILHRDIKPANLLLDAEGRLWVTDFGLAQIQGNHGLTLSGDILGTLRYMSPEQALAKRMVIDGRTDVYSLGVTLYELLTLQPAFNGKDRAEILRKIGEDDPTPLRKLNASVPQDLDTIIHRAMAKEPSERYATAKELADDLRYHLEDRPIRARRPSLLDRAAKWMRRHSASVAAAGVILVLALIGLATSTILIAREQRRTATALTQADARLQFARKAVDEMYTQVAEKWLAQQPKLTPLQREFLEKAMAFYEQFAAQSGDDPQAQFDAARARHRVGNINAKLGRGEQARTALRRSFEQLQSLSDRFPGRLEYLSELAFLGYDLSATEFNVGRHGDSELSSGRSVPILERLVALDPKNREYRARHASSLLKRGEILLFLGPGRLQEAEPILSRSRDLFAQLEREGPLDPIFRIRPSLCESNLGQLYAASGRVQDAEKAYRRAIAQLETLVAEEPSNPAQRALLALTLHRLARLQLTTRQFEEVIAIDRRCAALGETLVSEFPNVPLYREQCTVYLDNLQLSLLVTGRYEQAEQVASRGVDMAEKLDLAPEVQRVGDHNLGILCRNICMLAYHYSSSPTGDRPRRAAQALKLARRAVELMPEDGTARQSLGWALYRTGDWKGCIESLEKSSSHPGMHLEESAFFLAMAHWQLGEKDQARNWFERGDTWLKGYEERCTERLRSGGATYPTPLMLRRFRSEAASLLGIKEPDSKRTSRPTPKTGTESK